MKNRLFAALAALFLLLSLAACGNGEEPSGGGSRGGGQNEPAAPSGTGSTGQGGGNEDGPQAGTGTQPPAELTLADGEAKLVYAKDNYVVVAFHGPYKDIDAWFCDANGERLNYFLGYGRPSDGWTLIISREFPKDYDYSDLGVHITDHNAPRNEDGTYAGQEYIITKSMTDEEKRAIGLDFLDGHCCLMGNGTTMYGGDSFGLTFGITWFDDYYFIPFTDIDGFADRFSYFAGDGTPLEDYFDGYSTLKITTMINMFDVMLQQDSGPNDKDTNKSMCKELKACRPYLIYTGLDGTQQRFNLLAED